MDESNGAAGKYCCDHCAKIKKLKYQNKRIQQVKYTKSPKCRAVIFATFGNPPPHSVYVKFPFRCLNLYEYYYLCTLLLIRNIVFVNSLGRLE